MVLTALCLSWDAYCNGVEAPTQIIWNRSWFHMICVGATVWPILSTAGKTDIIIICKTFKIGLFVIIWITLKTYFFIIETNMFYRLFLNCSTCLFKVRLKCSLSRCFNAARTLWREALALQSVFSIIPLIHTCDAVGNQMCEVYPWMYLTSD